MVLFAKCINSCLCTPRWLEKNTGKHTCTRICWKENNSVILSGKFSKHLGKCRYPAAGPEKVYKMLDTFFLNPQKYKSILRSVRHYLLLSTECLQLQNQPASNRKRRGKKGKILNHLKKKRDRLPKKQRRWFLLCHVKTKYIWQLQNVPHCCWQDYISSS